MADSINIVRIDEISDCISRTIAGIRDGVATAIAAGVQAELPEKVDFNMIVIKDWQVLAHESSETGETIEAQGGKTTEKSGGTQSETRKATEQSEMIGENAHNEESKRTFTYTDV